MVTKAATIDAIQMTDLLPRAAGRIVLRRLTVADLADFQSYRQDPELGRYQGWVATPDDEARTFLTYMHQATLLQPGTWCQIGIADACSGALIGDIGLILSSDARQVQIGFTLSRTSQGQGLATLAVTEAMALVFESTPAAVVVGIADTRNLASVRLLERVGMRKVETRAATFRGEPCTELVYHAMRQP